MKKLFLSLLLALVLLVVAVIPVFAAPSDTVSIKALPTFLGIAITQAEKDFGTVVKNTNYDTTANFFEIVNTSNVTTNLTIYGTDFTGGSGWTLATDGAGAGSDTAGMYAGIVSGSFDIVVSASPGTTLKSGLGSSTDQSFHIRLNTPVNDFADGAQKTSTVTVVAAAA
jgi:hypothetical protein